MQLGMGPQYSRPHRAFAGEAAWACPVAWAAYAWRRAHGWAPAGPGSRCYHVGDESRVCCARVAQEPRSPTTGPKRHEHASPRCSPRCAPYEDHGGDRRAAPAGWPRLRPARPFARGANRQHHARTRGAGRWDRGEHETADAAPGGAAAGRGATPRVSAPPRPVP
jgi:hypothetical protein